MPGWQLGEGLTLDHSILGCLRLPLNGIKSRRTGRKFVKQRHSARVFLLRPKTLAVVPDELFSKRECGDVQRLHTGT